MLFSLIDQGENISPIDIINTFNMMKFELYKPSLERLRFKEINIMITAK